LCCGRIGVVDIAGADVGHIGGGSGVVCGRGDDAVDGDGVVVGVVVYGGDVVGCDGIGHDGCCGGGCGYGGGGWDMLLLLAPQWVVVSWCYWWCWCSVVVAVLPLFWCRDVLALVLALVLMMVLMSVLWMLICVMGMLSLLRRVPMLVVLVFVLMSVLYVVMLLFVSVELRVVELSL